MRCPFCDDGESQVVDSRLERGRATPSAGAAAAASCDRRFTTYERYDQGPLYIRKRSGGREPFDRAKLLAGSSAPRSSGRSSASSSRRWSTGSSPRCARGAARRAPTRSASWPCADCGRWTRSPTCASPRCTASSATSRSSRRSWSGSTPSRRCRTSTCSNPGVEGFRGRFRPTRGSHYFVTP